MKEVMVQYRDEYGLPRAYAWGPSEELVDIRKLASTQLDEYLGTGKASVANKTRAHFTEHILNI